jgi:DNA polymerase III delta subunit
VILDHILDDLCGNEQHIVGVIAILASYFLQVLPVISKGTMIDELKACLKSLNLWKDIIKMGLPMNIKVHLQGDVFAGSFAVRLFSLCDGKNTS